MQPCCFAYLGLGRDYQRCLLTHSSSTAGAQGCWGGELPFSKAGRVQLFLCMHYVGFAKPLRAVQEGLSFQRALSSLLSTYAVALCSNPATGLHNLKTCHLFLSLALNRLHNSLPSGYILYQLCNQQAGAERAWLMLNLTLLRHRHSE